MPTGRREGRFSMTIAEQKAAQRKAGIAARRALSDTERTHSNAALCARIMALDCFKKAVKGKGLERSFKMAIPKEVYETLEKEMEQLG